jgi:DNA polymerase III epsilon subunit-like protein
MNKYMLIDIETPYSFNAEDGIREIAAIVVCDNNIIDQLHLAIITDEDEYKKGYGSGLEAIEENQEFKTRFREFIKKHDCPVIAHYAPFERRFLTYWEWIDESQPLYCSLRAIKKQVPGLPKYSLSWLMSAYGFKKEQEHTALQDIIDLFELLKIINPTEWHQVGG